ncbi:MAG: hypothetical protein ACXVLM_22720, partial [Ilumatobacteraceae bacterium]
MGATVGVAVGVGVTVGVGEADGSVAGTYEAVIVGMGLAVAVGVGEADGLGAGGELAAPMAKATTLEVRPALVTTSTPWTRAVMDGTTQVMLV